MVISSPPPEFNVGEWALVILASIIATYFICVWIYNSHFKDDDD